MIPLEYYQKAKEYMSYNSITGMLVWKKKPAQRVKIGDKVGSVDSAKYYRTKITIDGAEKSILNHRIAWFICHSEAPEFIDHINGVKTDNRICNLRSCTKSENCRNSKRRKHNTSGYKGVCWRKDAKRWVAKINVNCKRLHLGYFDTAAEAYIAYCEAADKHHREFKNYGTG